MRAIGTLLIAIGLLCLAMIAVAWDGWASVGDEVAITPQSITSTVTTKVLPFLAAGIGCIVTGSLTLLRGISLSQERNQQAEPSSNRKLTFIAVVAIAAFACIPFVRFDDMTRWDADEEWAATVINESTDIRLLLDQFHKQNGEFPMELSELEDGYQRPTDYVSRNANPAGRSSWSYSRIGPNDYQLSVTAYSWVSYYDALVYRNSGEFKEPWFSALDDADWRDFGKWRYVSGFSQYEEDYYFDKDGTSIKR